MYGNRTVVFFTKPVVTLVSVDSDTNKRAMDFKFYAEIRPLLEITSLKQRIVLTLPADYYFLNSCV